MLNIIKEKKYIFILLIAIIILVCIIFNIIREKNTSKIVDNVDPFVEYAKTHIGEIDLSNNENVDIKDKRKYNNSKLIKKEHVYDLYKFDNMSISTQNDKCNISFDTFNLKDSSHIDYNVFICYYDNNNKLIRCLEFAFDDTNIGDKKHYDIETVEDVSNAYDYKVEGLLSNKE